MGKAPLKSRHQTPDRRVNTKWAWAILTVLVVAGELGWALDAAQRPEPAPMTSASFQPTAVNTALPPSPAPDGMVWIPGGEFSMGAADPPGMDDVGMQATTDSRPIHRVYVDGFWMDKTEVTNGARGRPWMPASSRLK